MLCLLVAVICRDVWYLRLVTRPGELLSVPMGDSTVYLQLARELATGGNAAHDPFYWSPLYSLFLALWSGSASSLIIVLQMLAGLGVLWFVFVAPSRPLSAFGLTYPVNSATLTRSAGIPARASLTNWNRIRRFRISSFELRILL